jgi:aldose 1-epimerase
LFNNYLFCLVFSNSEIKTNFKAVHKIKKSIMDITRTLFGKLRNGQDVYLYTLENDNQVKINITNYGGIITHLFVPDRHSNVSDVVLGFDDFESYLGDHPYLGAIVGRFANRIGGGKFSLNAKEYKLLVNNGPNHLHGGAEGFDKKLWLALTEKSKDSVSLKLNYISPDMEEGYPGNLKTEVIYSLNNQNELAIDYRARCDKDTIINLTNHSYFNLNIENGDIMDHFLKMDCPYFTVSDESSVPTGEIREVKGTPLDFQKEKTVAKDFDQLENGYDHNLIISKDPEEFKWFAKVREAITGRVMEVGTTEPGVQFYTANFLKDIRGKGGKTYQPQDGLCLETQHFPDSPNKPDFPSVFLRSGKQYYQKTVYKFSTED